MAINKESNGYIIGFAAVLVIVVGGLLAFIAMSLKPYQNANLENEKKQFILKAINVKVSRDEAGNQFDKYVKKRVIMSHSGEILSEVTGEINKQNEKDAFNVDLLKEYKSIAKAEDRNYPIFVCEKEGEKYYVIPVLGTGLWAAVWGYIGFDSNFNAVYGAVFDHKSETPGLGAEISKDFFGEQFIGKTIANAGGDFTSIKVVKPGLELDEHMVDGISGGTFTSVGVDEMIKRTAVVYHNYFKKNNEL